MKAVSNPDMFFMIHYLLIYLTDSPRNRLNNLRKDSIKRWADLERKFYNHFEGAYTKPGTSSDANARLARASVITSNALHGTRTNSRMSPMPALSPPLL
jgi:hypothetical protein